MTILEAGICTLCGIGGASLCALFWIGDSLFSIKLSMEGALCSPTLSPETEKGDDGA